MSLASKFLKISKRRRTNAVIELLAREGCHLCDDAERALVDVFGASNVGVIDISQRPDLEELYVFQIPVVLFAGQPIAEGVIGRREARQVRQDVRRRQRAGGPRS